MWSSSSLSVDPQFRQVLLILNHSVLRNDARAFTFLYHLARLFLIICGFFDGIVISVIHLRLRGLILMTCGLLCLP